MSYYFVSISQQRHARSGRHLSAFEELHALGLEGAADGLHGIMPPRYIALCCVHALNGGIANVCICWSVEATAQECIGVGSPGAEVVTRCRFAADNDNTLEGGPDQRRAAITETLEVAEYLSSLIIDGTETMKRDALCT